MITKILGVAIIVVAILLGLAFASLFQVVIFIKTGTPIYKNNNKN